MRLARLRKRRSLRTWRRQAFRGVEPWPDAGEALLALSRAWVVAMIATTFLLAALAVAPLWDRAVYLRALGDALSANPEMASPVDDIDPRQAPKPLFKP